MNLSQFGLLLVAVCASVVGQFLLKAGAVKLARLDLGAIAQVLWGIATTPELLLGLACYGAGAVSYILLLTKVDLSVASPAIALVYVFSVAIGYFVFRETIPPSRVVGLGLIVAGVILVVWKK